MELLNQYRDTKKFCNKLAHLIEQVKKIYYHKIITDSKHNIQLMWKTINDIA